MENGPQVGMEEAGNWQEAAGVVQGEESGPGALDTQSFEGAANRIC